MFNDNKVSTIPTFVLRRIIPKDCTIISEDGGFSITLENKIEDFIFATSNVKPYVDPMHIYLDDVELDQNKIFIIHKGDLFNYSYLSEGFQREIRVGDKIKIIYESTEEISEGKHTVEIFIESVAPFRIKFKTKFKKSSIEFLD